MALAYVGAPGFTSNPIAVSGYGTHRSAPDYTPTDPGTYRWIASYSGDVINAAIPGACNGANESVTISIPSPVQQITTLSEWMLLALGLLLASFGLVAVRRTTHWEGPRRPVPAIGRRANRQRPAYAAGSDDRPRV